MAKLPEPPSGRRLLELGPRIRRIAAGTELWRIYFRAGRYPGSWNDFRHFGPLSSSRFDHHLLPPSQRGRGIMYAASQIATCLAEVFQERMVVNRVRNEPWLVGFALAYDIELHDLMGTWPTEAGASMAINTGPHFRAQAWSRAIYATYADVHGLLYCSSMHANRPAIALYERAAHALPANPFFHRSLADPVLLNPLRVAAAGLGYSLV